jgi:peroxiredoxin
MKQFVQLQENLQSFKDAGITVVAMTYDAPELQQVFIDSQGITYPLLSDIDASSVKSLDILNTEYQPGDNAYGIPYPGVFVVNPNMEIVGKIFIEAYSTRVDAAGVLSFAIELLPHSEAIAQ